MTRDVQNRGSLDFLMYYNDSIIWWSAPLTALMRLRTHDVTTTFARIITDVVDAMRSNEVYSYVCIMKKK